MGTNVLLYIYPLLGKDRETNNGTTVVARQQPARQQCSDHVETPTHMLTTIVMTRCKETIAEDCKLRRLE
jgi:hypothetical protein